MTTTTDLARRDDRAFANVPAGALAIEAGQTAWTTMQAAALGQLGIADAPEGDKQVFLHVSQRTGLDPFAKQIYMIGRKENKKEKRGDRWVDNWTVKWSIQTGIEGFRVIRSRAERDEGVRGILSEAVYYDGKGQEYDTWYFQQPPVIVKMTYTVRDRNGIETPYVSKLRFDEYRQTRKENRDGTEVQVLSGQWATKPVHMLEKCTEADVYRKAFPQDFSGIHLDDTMPLPDPDDVPAQRQPAPQVGDLRQRAAAQTVTATVITDPSPAATEPPVSGPAASPTPTAEVAAAGDGLTRDELLGEINNHLQRLGVARANRIAKVSLVNRRQVSATAEMSDDEVRKVHDTLEGMEDGAALHAHLTDLDYDPRDEATDGA